MTDVLRAEVRDQAQTIDSLRTAGQVPGVIYGHGITNQTIMVSGHDLEKVYRTAGESTLVDLTIGSGAPVKVLIYDVQRNPLTNTFQHVDFYQVNMTEKLTTEIPLVFVGESAAVKALGGTLITSLEEVEVTCLPSDLVKEITVDISSLATFADKITVGSLAVPAGIEILTDKEAAVATVAEPRDEEPVSTPGEGAAAEAAVAEAANATASADEAGKDAKAE